VSASYTFTFPTTGFYYVYANWRVQAGDTSALASNVPVSFSTVTAPVVSVTLNPINQNVSPSDKRFDNVLYELVGRYNITAGSRRITISNTGTTVGKAVLFDSVRVVGDCVDTIPPVATSCPTGLTGNTDTGKAFATYTWTAPVWADDNGKLFSWRM
jgi:hypothetical protein